MINILIPMAGRSQRFTDAGYDVPKYLLKIGNKYLIEKVIESLKIENAHYIFCILKEHEEKYNISSILKNIVSNISIIFIDKITNGAVNTCLRAKKLINNDKKLIIANCDQIVNFDLSKFIYKINNFDGSIVYFINNNPKWSYININWFKQTIINVAEKKQISNFANVGIYGYRQGSDFVKSSEKMMLNPSNMINNEWYIAPSFNELIKENKIIKPLKCVQMFGCGTPEDFQYSSKFYINKNKDWSLKEDNFLRKNYKKMSNEDIGYKLCRFVSSVKNRANVLNLRGKKISFSDKEFLHAVLSSKTHNEAMKKLGYISNGPYTNKKTGKYKKFLQRLRPDTSHFSLASRSRENKCGASIKSYYNKYKYSAKERKIKFFLSLNEFKILVMNKCYYCGGNGTTSIHGYGYRNSTYRYCGIDRINSDLYYTNDNCVSCCKQCNKMKMSLQQQDFLNKIKQIYNNLKLDKDNANVKIN